MGDFFTFTFFCNFQGIFLSFFAFYFVRGKFMLFFLKALKE
jgi:hypothetical protein